MRVQVYIIMVLLGVLLWGLAFFGTRDAYRAAHTAGVIPNLKIKERLASIP
jgi:hypothetical protein